MTVDRKCEIHQRGVNGIRNLCQLMEMTRGRCKETWKGVTVVRKCDSPQELC